MTARSVGRQPRRVVIVDDSLTMSAILEQAFEAQRGFEVIGIARDVFAAAEMIRALRPDLATIDLCMPYIDGAELLRRTSDLAGTCKIIVSDHVDGNPRLATTLGKAGASAIISKRLLARDRASFFQSVTVAVERFERAGRARRRPDGGGAASAAATTSSTPKYGYPVPLDEAARLAALRRKGLNSAGCERTFDLLVKHAARATNFPMTLLSFVDRDVQWIKARHGLSLVASPREDAFCAHTICGDGPMIVRNATLDERFAGNPFVLGPPFIRSYVGQPVRLHDGTRLGALCLIDSKARNVSEGQLTTLRDLAMIAGEMVEQRPTAN